MKIINTRPGLSGEKLNQYLLEVGFQPYSFCPIEIIESNCLNFHDLRSHLDLYSDIIVTSAYAVTHGVEKLFDYWPQWPIDQHWWAIGDATAQALLPYGLNAQTPQAPQKTETLLEALEQHWQFKAIDPQQLKNRLKIGIITGEKGLGLLENKLLSDGFAVQSFEVYKRAPKVFTQQTLRLAHTAFSRAQGLVITSLDIYDRLEQLGLTSVILKRNIPIVVASERIKKILLHKGAQCVINSNSAKNEDIARSFVDSLNNNQTLL